MRSGSWVWTGTMVLAVALGGCNGLEKRIEEIAKSTSSLEQAPEDKQEGKEKDKEARASHKPESPSREREKPSAPPPREAEAYPPESAEADTPAPRKPGARSFRHEWYVSPSGSDGAKGSHEAPFRTINRALSAAEPGDGIRVQAGEYKENVVIDGKARAGTREAPITLLGEGMPRIVPGQGGGALVQVRRPYWHIEGFEVDVRGQSRFAAIFEGNTEGAVLADSHLHHGTLGGGITTFGGAHGITLEGNHIHDFRKPHDDSHGVVIQATSRDIVIRDNNIHDNSGDSVQCLKPDGAGQAPARGIVIERNHLYANGENGVDIKTCHDVVVRHNRMHDFHKSPTSAGEAVVVHYSARDVRIEDNDISNAGKGISVGGVKDGGPDPTDVVVKGNRIHGMSSAGGGDGTGIRVENSRKVQVLDNRIEDTDGYGMMLGLGANGAPSQDLEVSSNDIQTDKLVRVGQKRPGLRMDGNRYSSGGMFKADPLETRDFNRWKQQTGLDPGSQVK
jgi:nitrous oxidase accessory protein NosD